MAALAAGVKPLVGVDIWLHNEADHNLPTRLVLLCQDRSGYLNLTRLISRSYIEGQERGVPMLRKEWLQGASAGLIALSGKFGDVGQALLAGNRAAAAAAHAAADGGPGVATMDGQFLKPEDFEAHEARGCSHDGLTLDDPRRPRLY